MCQKAIIGLNIFILKSSTTFFWTVCLFSDSVPKPLLSRYPGFAPMYVKETVNFTCRVPVSSDWSYQWYEGEKKRPYTGSTISINLDVSHKGRYSCKASRGEKTLTGHSDEINLDVQGWSTKIHVTDIFKRSRNIQFIKLFCFSYCHSKL